MYLTRQEYINTKYRLYMDDKKKTTFNNIFPFISNRSNRRFHYIIKKFMSDKLLAQ